MPSSNPKQPSKEWLWSKTETDELKKAMNLQRTGSETLSISEQGKVLKAGDYNWPEVAKIHERKMRGIHGIPDEQIYENAYSGGACRCKAYRENLIEADVEKRMVRKGKREKMTEEVKVVKRNKVEKRKKMSEEKRERVKEGKRKEVERRRNMTEEEREEENKRRNMTDDEKNMERLAAVNRQVGIPGKRRYSWMM